jgi:hypothetical protein
MRQIPLLMGLFYIPNIIITMGISAITALGTPPGGSYLTSFLIHAIPLAAG